MNSSFQKACITGTAVAMWLALASGCNTSTEGAAGNVSFTPDDCGLVGGCDFASGLGVGGAAVVQISGLGSFSTAGVDLASDDLSVLTVDAIPDVNGKPAWEIFGMAPGLARLAAIDPGGKEVDAILVEVVTPARFTMHDFGNHAVGPQNDRPGYDEHWLVDAGQEVILLVTPVDEGEKPIMGRYEYTTVIETAAFDAFIKNRNDLAKGTLDFLATEPGEYGVRFNGVGSTASLAVLIEAVVTQ